MKYKLALVMSVLCAFSAWTEAKVKLPAILSDGMVLQRERPVKIWGNADKGENVTVVFKKKKFSTVAGEDGKWLVELPPMKAGGPFEMTVNDIRLKDILVGDVVWRMRNDSLPGNLWTFLLAGEKNCGY